MVHTRSRSIARIIAFCFFIVVLSAQGAAFSADVTEYDKELYYQALQDAKTLDQEDISRRLLAILPWWDEVNSQILKGGEMQWEGEPGESRLLVVAFMKRQDYEDYYKDHMETKRQEDYTLKKSLWVTVVPELQNYFMPSGMPYSKVLSCPPTPKRVVQLLGLNPARDYDVLVEMWVDPDDLFRPSADPETNDHEAELAYKNALGIWIFPLESNPFLKYDDGALYMDSAWSQAVPYREWFAARADTVYEVVDFNDMTTWGDPWTALGFTWDWGAHVDHVGLSEFLVRLDPDQGGEVKVKLERAVDSATPQWSTYFRCWQ